MAKGRTIYPNELSEKFTSDNKIESLTKYYNQFTELLVKYDLNLNKLEDVIKYHIKYQDRTDALENMLYYNLDKLIGNQSQMIMPDVNLSNTNTSEIDTIQLEARKYGLSKDEFIQMKEKATGLGYDIQTYIDIQKSNEDEDDY